MLTQSLVRTTHINNGNMITLLDQLPNEVVGKEGFSRTRRAQNKHISIGNQALFHGGNPVVNRDGNAKIPLAEFDAIDAIILRIGFNREEHTSGIR